MGRCGGNLTLEASVAFWWNHSRASETNCSSSASIPSRVFQGNHFFPLCWNFKPSVAHWIGSMCLWPLCFMVTCQAFCARGARWKNAAAVSRMDCTRPPGQESEGGWLELSTPLLFLEQTHPQRSYTWMLEWSSSHRSIRINTLRALVHANICTGVWNCF